MERFYAFFSLLLIQKSWICSSESPFVSGISLQVKMSPDIQTPTRISYNFGIIPAVICFEVG